MISTAEVPLAFDEAAPSYDTMVAANPGYHDHLDAAAEALIDGLPGLGPVRVVDLGCGSGASTQALVRAAGDAGRGLVAVGVDASAGMLDAARGKRWPAGITFAQGLAQELSTDRAALGLDEPVDGVLAAYLFRNVAREERDAVLADVHALLAPGGVLVVQEYSVAHSRRARLVWTLVCWLVVVPLAWVTSRRTRLYRYLWRSVCDFDAVQTFTDRLWAAGFVDVEVAPVRGWQRGILHTVRARRPDAGPAVGHRR